MKKFLIFKIQFLGERGFTLIEILTVVGILSILGALVVSILTTTLRETNKSDLLNVARASGDTALNQMVKSIRYAKSLDNPATCTTPVTTSSITFTSLLDLRQTTYACGGGTISSNSASLFDTTGLKVSACSFTCSQATTLDPPTITIQYTLTPRNPGTFTESKFTQSFQTSVTLRNVIQSF